MLPTAFHLKTQVLTKYFWVSYLFIFSLNYSALFSGQEGQVGRHSHADGDQRTSFWTQPPLFSNVVA